MLGVLIRKRPARLACILLAFLVFFSAHGAEASAKSRVFVLTDIENEPDDAMSVVRFLLYSNQWDVEGLVATTSVHQRNRTTAWRLREIIGAYAKVRSNLLRHEGGFPTAGHLLSLVRAGLPVYGMAGVGKGHDSPGSELLISAVDRADSRPLWVTIWGGASVLAQSLWKVQATRRHDEVQRFVSRLRVYTISDQDDAGPWIRRTFPKLFYIVSPGFHPLGGYHHATWTGISGDRFHGRFVGADAAIVDNQWLDTFIRSKGPLGAQYPRTKFLMEGDSPSFLYLIDNGLGDPERPDWGSWGGRYEYYVPPFRKWHLEAETRPIWSDAVDEVLGVDGNWHTSNQATIWRWREAYQNDFRARMSWTVTRDYAGANHPPIVKILRQSLVAAPGDRVDLSVDATDPDRDALSYRWFHYGEIGTFTLSSGRTGAPLAFVDADKPNASFTVPDRVGRLGTLHVIVAVTDRGVPPLTRYGRVLVTVGPKSPP